MGKGPPGNRKEQSKDCCEQAKLSDFVSSIVSTASAGVLAMSQQHSEMDREPDKPFQQREKDGVEDSVSRQEVSTFVSPSYLQLLPVCWQ